MKLILTIAILFPAITAEIAQETNVAGQQQQQQETYAELVAKHHLHLATLAYREGNFKEAQWHSEQALKADPENSTAPFFIARCIHAQYRPGDNSDSNRIKAREAIEAYRRVMSKDPLNEEAYKCIAFLLNSLKEEENLRQWLLQRATDPRVSAEKRGEAYIALASKDWDCAYQITELPLNKITEKGDHGTKVEYIKPREHGQFEKAKRCAAGGLRTIEMAILLSPNSEAAWSYKTNLLLELAKLAEMEGDHPLRDSYRQQLKAAQERTFELSRLRQP